MRATLIFLLTILLCACNSDIFVDDFTPDVTEVTMEGENSSRTIHFRSDDWSTLTLVGGSLYSLDMPAVVTPEGGVPSPGKTLQGNGSISVSTPLTSFTVTRRGADVTVDVDYAIGNDFLFIWLEARSELTYDMHDVEVRIERVGGIEIESVDYTLNSWGSLPEEAEGRMLAAYALTAGHAPLIWQPELPSGLLAFYRFRTTTESEMYLNALAGEKIPVPTKTNANFSDWELRGETAEIGYNPGYTHLLHYPPFPRVSVQPGTVTSFNALMEPTVFDIAMTVKNKYSGEKYDMIVWLTIEQPEMYYVTSDEIK